MSFRKLRVLSTPCYRAAPKLGGLYKLSLFNTEGGLKCAQVQKTKFLASLLLACEIPPLVADSSWEGSASDFRVLHDVVTRPNGLRVPTGYYYLVDGGYTNGERFLAPYRGTMYHLSEWGDENMPRDHVEYFNMKHSKARNVIERCFGLLKGR
ncbi:hypothetical protein ACLB2K_038161 [Fragaria x ananassa]